jgi:hypothetical protein
VNLVCLAITFAVLPKIGVAAFGPADLNGVRGSRPKILIQKLAEHVEQFTGLTGRWPFDFDPARHLHARYENSPGMPRERGPRHEAVNGLLVAQLRTGSSPHKNPGGASSSVDSVERDPPHRREMGNVKVLKSYPGPVSLTRGSELSAHDGELAVSSLSGQNGGHESGYPKKNPPRFDSRPKANPPEVDEKEQRHPKGFQEPAQKGWPEFWALLGTLLLLWVPAELFIHFEGRRNEG